MPQWIVLHYTAMDSAGEALERLCDPQAEVSAHYLIGSDGMLWQMVDEPCRAWHAGAGQWQGLDDVNSRSIGIELDNRGNHPFAEPQMAVRRRCCRRSWDAGASRRGCDRHSTVRRVASLIPAHVLTGRLVRQGLAVPRQWTIDAASLCCHMLTRGGSEAARRVPRRRGKSDPEATVPGNARAGLAGSLPGPTESATENRPPCMQGKGETVWRPRARQQGWHASPTGSNAE